ncbi:nitrate transporter [Breoghania sp. L-A4]|nr:CmpA/NrtA family ABC transporter substrate-binding protein [Breoghania sp. L-A4]AXS42795.1 nitrate transporter [Breoghania sp. L-A4]
MSQASPSRGDASDSRTVVCAGFIPLTDCAPLVVAAHKGFAADEGLTLELHRETSWATIRDRVVFGHFDVAQMLAPMPLARSLGIGHIKVPMIAPCALSQGGNAITVSADLWQRMEGAGARLGAAPGTNGAALAAVIKARDRSEPLVFAMVYPFSGHNYELRYWLAAAGIHPDRDVRLIVVPPPMMGAALAAGQIDGFCVGEPWSSLAVDEGSGRIAATKADIWRQSPEKVLGCRRDWADANADTLAALIRALHAAARWADDPGNRDALCALLAHPDHLNVPAGVIGRALTGRLIAAPGTEPLEIPDFLAFHRHAASFPWRSHALWIYSQMVRWGQVPFSAEGMRAAADTYRPDLYRAALAGTGAVIPNASAKVEGALTRAEPVAAGDKTLTLGPDGFFDERIFDPAEVEAYIASFAIHTEPLDGDAVRPADPSGIR